MAENDKNISENDKNNSVSQQNIKLDIIEKLKYLVENYNPEKKDDTLKEIDNLENDDKSQKFKNFFDLIKNTINGNVSRAEYKKQVEKLEGEYQTQLDFDMDALFTAGVQKQSEGETIADLVSEIKAEHSDKSNEEISASIKEIIQNEATIAEVDEDDIFETDFKLSRPEKEKIKKIYKYKVEGKITSGIEDLDTFLGIIQPALNQIVITGWKGIFGLSDLKNFALENFENWQAKKKNLATAWKTLQALGFVDANEKFSYLGSNKEKEDLIAKIFNDNMCRKLNEFLKEEEFRNSVSTEQDGSQNTPINDANSFKPRRKFFDHKYSAEEPRIVLVSTLQNLIKDKCRDENGKISEDGEKLLKGFSVIIDLFNMEDKDTIPNYYAKDFAYIFKEAKKRTTPGDPPIEYDETLITKLDEEEENSKLDRLLEEKFKQMQESK